MVYLRTGIQEGIGVAVQRYIPACKCLSGIMRVRKVPKAEVEKPATDAKEEEETNGDAAPPAKKAKAEPARTRPQRESKSAGGRRVSSLEAAAKEGEALLKELGHKDSSDPDSGRRRTRSQTRGTPAAPPARQQRQTRAEPARKTPTKPARGASKKAAASKRSKKDEDEDEEEEEAASAEEASTAATNEDELADSKDKKDEKKDEVNNDEDVGKARQADSEDDDADHKEEPEVNNKEEKTTTDSSSSKAATTTTDGKADAEPPIAKENAIAGDSVATPPAAKPPATKPLEEVAA